MEKPCRALSIHHQALRLSYSPIPSAKAGALQVFVGTAEGELIRTAGVMGMVGATGEVGPRDASLVHDAPPLFKALKPV